MIGRGTRGGPSWTQPIPSSHHGKSAFSPAVVSVIAVLGSAFLVVSYYRIFAKFCTRWQYNRELIDLEAQTPGMDNQPGISPLLNHGLQPSLLKMVPVFGYKTGETFTVETECPVCLGEFLDHQELRLLPKCAHAFHVPCIDTWLSTHSTCPVCRAPIFPENVIRQAVIQAHQRATSDGFRFGPLPPEGMVNSPHTLRGLLNFEDAHSIWYPTLYPTGSPSPDGMLVVDPGEESRRLSDMRQNDRAYLAWAGNSSGQNHGSGLDSGLQRDESSRGSADSRSGTYFSTPTGPESQTSLTRTASCKESSSSKERSRWQIPSRRLSSFRKNPFSIVVRSYSMGTSRRYAHGMEFLDLDELRAAAGLGRSGTNPEFSATLSTAHVPGTPKGECSKSSDGAGPSNRSIATKDSVVNWSRCLSTRNYNNPETEKGEASLKSSSARGRSKSFRSPFGLKRSLSGGRTVFSFRMDHSSRGRIFSMDSPPIS
ncbi:hypothetical protein R1sor_020734 [Riccia sorocarpa]|uniref:RING-type E3 ubiquitin transferase n=1 Tax=Riccia sorocarpa TaxID=122646 RepID=A0ABD3GF28_9MARC